MKTRRSIALVAVALGFLFAACKSGGGGGSTGPVPTPSPTPTPGPSVLEHHHAGNRRGVYVIPEMTKAHASSLVMDTAFAPAVTGNVYAQPLYVSNAGHDLVFVVTESNEVSAFWASNGAVAWQRVLATPVNGAILPCGNIDPLGITSTPYIDLGSRTIYLDAMTDAGGGTPAHEIYALSIDDGSTRAGWPVDANTAITDGSTTFDSTTQNQRGAIAFLNGTVYVGYGGLAGDCGTYYGWLAGVNASNPAQVTSWKSPLTGTAIWGMSGPATDGEHLYVATGNGMQIQNDWALTEAILRFQPGPVFSGSTADEFTPSNWHYLDVNDVDLGGTNPVLVDLEGRPLVVALGKDGKIYVLDRTNLGGIGGELVQNQVASNEIINAAAAYTTPLGTYVVFKGDSIGCPGGDLAGGALTAVKLTQSSAGAISANVAWCASQGGDGSPMVTQTQPDGGDTIVWGLGTEGEDVGAGDSRLRGFDGDTGAVVFDGGGAAEQMGSLHRYITPIAAAGKIYVAGDGRVYAFR